MCVRSLKKGRNKRDKKEQIIEDYNLTSHFYDQRYAHIQYEKFAYLVSCSSLSNKIILDAGCGTGLLLDYIENAVNKSCINDFVFVAIDISWNMLQEFKIKLELDKSILKHIDQLILADIENLPLREDSFHIIFSLTALQNLQFLKKGIMELHRVGKNDADLNLSILKKKLDFNELEQVLKSISRNIVITNKDELEDVIIKSLLLKK